MKCSVILAFVLAGTPLRWITPYFRCVVSMISWLPTTLPVEKPSHVCSALADGCGRPSIQMMRSLRPNTPSSV